GKPPLLPFCEISSEILAGELYQQLPSLVVRPPGGVTQRLDKIWNTCRFPDAPKVISSIHPKIIIRRIKLLQRDIVRHSRTPLTEYAVGAVSVAALWVYYGALVAF